MARFRGELKELPSSCGGSLAVSLTVSKSESSRRHSENHASSEPITHTQTHTREGSGLCPSESELTKVGVVSLVEEQLVAHSLHDDVPGVDRARAAHQSGQDGVGGKHVSLSLRQLRRQRMLPSSMKRSGRAGGASEGQTLRMTGSSVVVTVWKILLMLFSCFSLRVVIRSNALS